jgi:hypothetical protein
MYMYIYVCMYMYYDPYEAAARFLRAHVYIRTKILVD